MVSLGTKVILLGGEEMRPQKDIYQLSSPIGVWEELPQKLLNPRSNFVAFTIPANWTHCWKYFSNVFKVIADHISKIQIDLFFLNEMYSVLYANKTN